MSFFTHISKQQKHYDLHLYLHCVQHLPSLPSELMQCEVFRKGNLKKSSRMGIIEHHACEWNETMEWKMTLYEHKKSKKRDSKLYIFRVRSVDARTAPALHSVSLRNKYNVCYQAHIDFGEINWEEEKEHTENFVLKNMNLKEGDREEKSAVLKVTYKITPSNNNKPMSSPHFTPLPVLSSNSSFSTRAPLHNSPPSERDRDCDGLVLSPEVLPQSLGTRLHHVKEDDDEKATQQHLELDAIDLQQHRVSTRNNDRPPPSASPSRRSLTRPLDATLPPLPPAHHTPSSHARSFKYQHDDANHNNNNNNHNNQHNHNHNHNDDDDQADSDDDDPPPPLPAPLSTHTSSSVQHDSLYSSYCSDEITVEDVLAPSFHDPLAATPMVDSARDKEKDSVVDAPVKSGGTLKSFVKRISQLGKTVNVLKSSAEATRSRNNSLNAPTTAPLAHAQSHVAQDTNYNFASNAHSHSHAHSHAHAHSHTHSQALSHSHTHHTLATSSSFTSFTSSSSSDDSIDAPDSNKSSTLDQLLHANTPILDITSPSSLPSTDSHSSLPSLPSPTFASRSVRPSFPHSSPVKHSAAHRQRSPYSSLNKEEQNALNGGVGSTALLNFNIHATPTYVDTNQTIEAGSYASYRAAQKSARRATACSSFLSPSNSAPRDMFAALNSPEGKAQFQSMLNAHKAAQTLSGPLNNTNNSSTEPSHQSSNNTPSLTSSEPFTSPPTSAINSSSNSSSTSLTNLLNTSDTSSSASNSVPKHRTRHSHSKSLFLGSHSFSQYTHSIDPASPLSPKSPALQSGIPRHPGSSTNSNAPANQNFNSNVPASNSGAVAPVASPPRKPSSSTVSSLESFLQIEREQERKLKPNLDFLLGLFNLPIPQTSDTSTQLSPNTNNNSKTFYNDIPVFAVMLMRCLSQWESFAVFSFLSNSSTSPLDRCAARSWMLSDALHYLHEVVNSCCRNATAGQPTDALCYLLTQLTHILHFVTRYQESPHNQPPYPPTHSDTDLCTVNSDSSASSANPILARFNWNACDDGALLDVNSFQITPYLPADPSQRVSQLLQTSTQSSISTPIYTLSSGLSTYAWFILSLRSLTTCVFQCLLEVVLTEVEALDCLSVLAVEEDHELGSPTLDALLQCYTRIANTMRAQKVPASIQTTFITSLLIALNRTLFNGVMSNTNCMQMRIGMRLQIVYSSIEEWCVNQLESQQQAQQCIQALHTCKQLAMLLLLHKSHLDMSMLKEVAPALTPIQWFHVLLNFTVSSTPTHSPTHTNNGATTADIAPVDQVSPQCLEELENYMSSRMSRQSKQSGDTPFVDVYQPVHGSFVLELEPMQLSKVPIPPELYHHTSFTFLQQSDELDL